MAASERRYDILFFGATGFTGGLTADYLAAHPDMAELRWALAGRNPEKLGAVRDRLAATAPGGPEPELLTADIGDESRLAELVPQARVVITTVGPYIHHGEKLAAACAAAGTDYVDLTGEPEFVDLVRTRHDQAARDSGARLVNCCGFDSIPHDLGVLYTVDRLPQGLPITIEGYVQAGGTPSGGTWHSAIHAFARARQYTAQRRRMARGDRQGQGEPARRVGSLPARIHWVDRIGAWACPFPTVDPQVIKRSARTLNEYGPDFRYGHFVAVKHLPKLLAGAAGVGGLFLGAQVAPLRKLLLSLRDPGQGPDEAQRAKGWFRVRFRARAGSTELLTQVSGGDPGYGDTAKMLAESALTLATSGSPHPDGGVLTPAVALGRPLIARLERAGLRFDVLAGG